MTWAIHHKSHENPFFSTLRVTELSAARADDSFGRVARMFGLRPLRGIHPAPGCLVCIPDYEFPYLVAGVEVGECFRAGMEPAVSPSVRSLIIRDADGNPLGVWYPGLRCLITVSAEWVPDNELMRRLLSECPTIPHPPDEELVRVTIGCDPEFEVWSQAGEFVPASSFIDDPEGRDPIGRDEEGKQIEFRPGPGTPEQVIGNLRELFAEFAERFPHFYLDAAGHRAACGGHIHIGISVLGQYGLLQGPRATNEYIAALDRALGFSVYKSGRARGKYAHRLVEGLNSWGFEYRTPPAAVFGDPDTAWAALTIAHGIVRHLALYEELEIRRIAALADIGVPRSAIEIWLRFLNSPLPELVLVLKNWHIT